MKNNSITNQVSQLVFTDKMGNEILIFTGEGEAFFKGRKVTNDAQIESGLRLFLIENNYINTTTKR